jgi:repressor LexA
MEATNELTYRRYEALREAKGYSNYRVSKESGVGQSTLSDWKSGKITPKLGTLFKIAETLGVTPMDFYKEERA